MPNRGGRKLLPARNEDQLRGNINVLIDVSGEESIRYASVIQKLAHRQTVGFVAGGAAKLSLAGLNKVVPVDTFVFMGSPLLNLIFLGRNPLEVLR